MTTQTPTSKPMDSVLPHDVPTGPPAGLPDPATLASLANAFFSALPGNAPQVGGAPDVAATLPFTAPVTSEISNPAPAGSPLAGPGGAGTGVPGAALPQGHVPGGNLLPSAPTNLLSLGNRAPALAPHAVAQNGLPDSAVTVAPALDPRFGGAALGVPEGHGAQRPSAGGASPASPVSASPYYFLGETAQARTSTVASPDIVVPGWNEVSAQSLGLPGVDQPLAEQRFPYDRPAASQAAPSVRPAEHTGNSHYFLNLNEGSRFPGHTSAKTDGVPHAGPSAHPPFDVNAIRRDFPILQERVNGRQLVWFDNAATTHKPQTVIDRLAYFYAHENSNIHRAAHALAGRATDAYEAARSKVQRFIGAASPEEIIFVRGTTEAINLIAKTWGVKHVGEGDEIIVSHLEHHANIVPWQQLAAQTGAKLRVIPVDDSGQVLLDEYRRLLNDRTKIVSVTQVSNALGTVVPVKEIVELAHRAGAKALVDGAQSVSHMRVDVQALDADFFVFSGHKVFGPTGIGVVYGKRAILEGMPPWQGGGNMIADVTFERTVFQPPPNRFEAGTGNIADAVGLGAAIDYVQRVGIENIARYEHDLLAYATSVLQPVPGVRLIGTARDKASVLSFVLKGYETEEVGQALNEEGIAVRSGHHCAQPILRRFGVEATVRPSLAFYNTCDEVDALVSVVRRLSSRR
ncbi:MULTISPECIES: family 2A encapsulin nanocompartment cargo protein cysteine desulfurase [Paraburkholderia]|uniref:cysteine desulfurase n=1 Tax=Paraburkholderia madseniana TaxID=2599607 RepID=A0AAP5BE72_9BURK|nr:MULTISPECIES: family 2A encapsulin nanocompartment cargo protein cysteine desulfurase [Paraburkholderia]MCX4146493.1 family 2A encapsulin nanocompartment cargo protein cysteine desulfurase [Paraburkholderia madseniana]MDN7149439.1 SufS family cysteine desulfurase [Paraburkholderia sp. WS6]MDQ6408319.1 SufS family cysteine desulfurase [Paraburkholderia madseniana]